MLALPDHGLIKEVQPIRVQVVDPLKAPPGPAITAPAPVPQAIGDVIDEEDRENRAPAATPPQLQPTQESHHVHVWPFSPNTLKPAIETLSSLAGDADNAPQYVGCVHQYPMHSMCSGLMCRSGGAGALLTFGAFEELAQDFMPTPSTLDLQPIRDTLDAPNANEWCTAMGIEIENICCVNVLKTVPHSSDMNINTLRWVFHWKFENGILVKYKAASSC